MKKIILFASALIVCCLLSTPAFSQLSLPAIFSDNMVLQQKTDASIWGKAAPNSKVKIETSWNRKKYIADSDAGGKWKLTVKTPPAGGPYEINISNGKNSTTLRNVMIGEVWICSGQSNMEMPLAGWGKIRNYEQEIAAADHPNIRLLQVKKRTSSYPLEELSLAWDGWQECAPAAIPEFSATAYFFGRSLAENLKVPIGLIHTSWGGTLAEAWTSTESLKTMPDFRARAKAFSQLPRDPEKQQVFFSQKLEEWNQKVIAMDFGFKEEVAVAATPGFADDAWKEVSLPGCWEENGIPDFDGFVWYRKAIDLPEKWTGNNLLLSLGAIDDDDTTYFNGVKIGSTQGAAKVRKYTVPANLIKKGRNIIAVRVFDMGGPGGFRGEEGSLYIAQQPNETEKINLNEGWKCQPAVSLKEAGMAPQNTLTSPHNPSTLYNAMLAPFVPFAFKGAIWYQGESNAGRAYQYRTLFPLMINDWRKQWETEFPFYFVQLANYMQIKEAPAESAWAELREAQLQTLHLNNTGMAVIIDIGEAGDIHPKNKQEVGRRLALLARNKTYGEKIVSCGPLYDSYTIENGKIRITFKPSESPLKISEGTVLKGFAIAGPDKIFHWAKAVIDGNDVVVSAPEVAFPIAVRYAWADNPLCNLTNEAGLPASPFRTDDWPGVTINNK